MEKNNMYDVIVIGGGPAGVSAAVYVARGGKTVALFCGAHSALDKSRIENYYGFSSIDGAELYSRGLAQARASGAEVFEREAAFCAFDGTRFSVSAGGDFFAKKLVIATGSPRKKSGINGLDELVGKGVSYCAVCDGFFYRKKRVAVLGAGEFARHEYSVLKELAGDITLLTDGAHTDFTAQKTDARKISGVKQKDGKLYSVLFEDGDELVIDGLFVALGSLGAGDVAKSMGVFTDANGSIVTDENRRTNIDGLYAAGDCTAGIKQVAKAVCDGMLAGLDILKSLKK